MKSEWKPAPQEFASRITEVTFRLLANCQEKEGRLAAQFGISVSDFRTLRMFRYTDRLNVKKLVELTGLSGSRLSRILDDLEAKSLVARSIDPEDRRSAVATLTEKGIAIVKSLEDRSVQIHEEILADVPREQWEPLLSGLERMLASLERWLKTS